MYQTVTMHLIQVAFSISVFMGTLSTVHEGNIEPHESTCSGTVRRTFKLCKPENILNSIMHPVADLHASL